jgi:predicted regulator of Ras-like GTPase activity (Roadblock/LC7/MglB family)
MNFSFKRLLKKEKEAPPAALVATEPRGPIEKPASERFGKTVMPKSARGAEPEIVPPLPSSLGGQVAVPSPFVPPSAPPPARKPISLGQDLPNEPLPSPLAPPPVATIRLPMPPAGNLPSPPIPARPSRPTISSNGTGAPAIERVPASSEPPVPISLPSPFAPAPARIKLPSLAPAPPFVLAQGPPVELSLREVLSAIPPFQLTGSTDHVPEGAKIELAFSLIKPQLASGKVEISPAQFHAAMPEEFRSLFVLDEGGLPISLPLAEVLEHLPNESLNLRVDQEETEIAHVFETPFSQHAAEDAARLQSPSGPIAKASPLESNEAISEVAPEPVAEPRVMRTPLQTLFETDEELDPKGVVARLSQLPGVQACAIIFSDGLSLASNIPPELGADKLCAVAPEIARRLERPIVDLSLGAVHAITIFYTKAPVSFFAHGSICLAAVHSADQFASETRDRLEHITQELGKIYAQPASLTPNA